MINMPPSFTMNLLEAFGVVSGAVAGYSLMMASLSKKWLWVFAGGLLCSATYIVISFS